MNYIRHLSAFFDKVAMDERLTPFHIAMYMALFQFWNLNRFENPVSIARSEILKLSRLGSTHTYYKCLNELHQWDYIQYIPSKNPLKGSLVNMCIFDTSNAQVVHMSCSKNDTSNAQAVHPSINNINIVNNKTLSDTQSQNDIDNLKSDNMKKKKSKRKKSELPPSLDQIKTYFTIEGFPELEAHKFFNHFQSNGWRVGGKSPMKDWHAAARNWMLNAQNFTPKSKPDTIKLNKSKNYNEPL